MRTLAHISDLHFGAHEPALVDALAAALLAVAPDLVVVSGDLTQRARGHQFRAADAFLARLEAAGLKLLVVPGNHDVPMHRPIERLVAPLGRYRRRIAQGRASWFADEEMAVLGLASAHGLTVKHGRLGRRQVGTIGACFARAPGGALRILVTHHPLVPLPGDEAEPEPALRGAARALHAIEAADVGLVLAGHHHRHGVLVGNAALSTDRRVLVVQAGTATSWRRRAEPNGFNLLRLDGRRLAIEEWVSDGGPFSSRSRSAAYERYGDGWAGG